MACSASVEESAANLTRAALYVTSCFSLTAFKILSLSWKFAILTIMCLAVSLFGFLLIGTLCVSDQPGVSLAGSGSGLHSHLSRRHLPPRVWMNVFLTPLLLDLHANDFLAVLVALCF